MNTLFVEPFSGMSGDMFLGALCGLADAYDDIVDLPRRLKLPDGAVEIREVSKNGIVCKHVEVIDRSAAHEHADHHHHKHRSDPHPPHHHHHHGHGSDHHPPHRRLSDILAIIDGADITDGARTIAREIFRLIGRAESEVHGIPIETIHFHEISAVDSIIDIVGSAVLLDRLQIDHVISRPICVGHGTVHIQHGLLPVPAPATAKLLHGMPTYRGEEPGERVTPTGAAILRYLRPAFEDRPLVIEREAYGPGKKDFALANVLRLSLASEPGATERLFVVETNLDDCSPELVGAT
ncbi:MAG: LarC family nickel insertion protein, partial [Spirochaetales bacterium]|nr:LarC family nickel insertion protein [Spirochaetales bacterium]